ncbi:hypothetical protein TNIN_125831 [Trichonephila inaurata madagascariensis]|uniref:Secreted protein n=1 Tax=Trichonephila inaurata madagascariensis TaxID=2747483 RepID=A0A8X6KG12_9ARAC|nr:hypothetical protein TNIN_125831 [Trichonephila inaurata madagascariensis]
MFEFLSLFFLQWSICDAIKLYANSLRRNVNRRRLVEFLLLENVLTLQSWLGMELRKKSCFRNVLLIFYKYPDREDSLKTNL